MNKIASGLLRMPIFLVPLLFVFLGKNYEDSLYFVLAGVSFVFSILVVVPSLFAEREIGIPKIKTRKLKKSVLTRSLGLKAIKKASKTRIGKRLSGSSLVATGLLFIATLGFFSYLSVYKLPLPLKETNIFFSYYLSQMEVLREMKTPLLIVIISTLIIFIYINRRKRKRAASFFETFFFSAFLVLVTIIISFNVSFLTTYLIGIGQVNLLAYQIKVNPRSADIVWGKEAVLNKLKSMDDPPRILGTDYGVERMIISINIDRDGEKGKFYTQLIINNIPNIFLSSLRLPKETLIMSGDFLLITEINKSEIETISPTVGKLFVKQGLKPRYIEEKEPVVKVMGRQEYLRYRDEQINKQLEEIDKWISDTQAYLNQLYSNIQKAKQEIPAFENLINDSIAKRDSYDRYCRSLSYCGYYYCYDYTDYCNQEREEWNRYIAGLEEDLEEWKAYLNELQREAGIQEENKKVVVDYKELVAQQKDIAPQELGLFEPEKSVKVVLESTSSKSLADYFATLVHEYLHYISYVSRERELPLFFEEGLTEYFTRKIIREELKTSTNLGYPLLAKVIEEMAKKIPEEELADIYFTKDEKTLKLTLNSLYGKNFYEDSDYYFWVMPYLPPRDALKFANNIIFKIGGDELKEEDLFSSHSEMK